MCIFAFYATTMGLPLIFEGIGFRKTTKTEIRTHVHLWGKKSHAPKHNRQLPKEKTLQ